MNVRHCAHPRLAKVVRDGLHTHGCIAYETHNKQFAAVPHLENGLKRREELLDMVDEIAAVAGLDDVREGTMDADRHAETAGHL